MIDTIQWLGYGSFLLPGPPLIYINPWRITRANFLADVILIGHHHHQHFSAGDIQRLCGPNTRIITNTRVAQELPNSEVLRPWQTITADRAGIKAVPAYSPPYQDHPISDGGLGFIVSLNYYDLYYAGDTCLTPEMQNIHPDIAILPIDGNSTLDAEEAVEAVRLMRPRWVIPCNYMPDGSTQSQVAVRLFAQRAQAYAQVVLPNQTSG
jgi:L-ascorbate metabolism protein UlaG (beta-lactamase superfamily)